MMLTISYSLISDYRKVLKNELCFKIFKEKHIYKTAPFVQSEKQAAGIWFEYACTGATKYNGEVPEVVLCKTKKDGIYEPLAIYRNLQKQVSTFNEIYKDIIGYEKNKTVEFEFEGFKLKIKMDVFIDGEVIRDIKTTELIDNKWEEGGWIDIKGKPKVEQAKFYIFVMLLTQGIIYPFYFDVFSSKDLQAKVFKIEMDDKAIDFYSEELKRILGNLTKHLESNEINPYFNNCVSCDQKKTCENARLTPNIEIVEFY